MRKQKWSLEPYAICVDEHTQLHRTFQLKSPFVGHKWCGVFHLLFVKLGEARRRRQHQAQRFWLAGYVEENEVRQSLRTASCV